MKDPNHSRPASLALRSAADFQQRANREGIEKALIEEKWKQAVRKIFRDKQFEKNLTLLGESKNSVLRFRDPGNKRKYLVFRKIPSEEAERQFQLTRFDHDICPSIVAQPLYQESFGEYTYQVLRYFKGTTLGHLRTEDTEKLSKQIYQKVIEYLRKRSEKSDKLSDYGVSVETVNYEQQFKKAIGRIREKVPDFNYQRIIEKMMTCFSMCDALPKALIHQDLTPENIMVGEEYFDNRDCSYLELCILDPERTAIGAELADIVGLELAGLKEPDEAFVEEFFDAEKYEEQRNIALICKGFQLMGRAMKHGQTYEEKEIEKLERLPDLTHYDWIVRNAERRWEEAKRDFRSYLYEVISATNKLAEKEKDENLREGELGLWELDRKVNETGYQPKIKELKDALKKKREDPNYSEPPSFLLR